MSEPIVLIGGGGHCRSCIDVIEEQGRFTIAGIVDLSENREQSVLGYPVIGADADLERLVREFGNVLITSGPAGLDTRRAGLFARLKRLGARFPVVQSPLAHVSSHARVAEGTIVMHQALIDAGARIGRNCIVDSRALVERDALIGEHCHLAAGAVVKSGTTISEGTFFGAEAGGAEGVPSRWSGEPGGIRTFSSVQCSSRPIKIAIFGASGFSREAADVALLDQVEALVFIDLHPRADAYHGFPVLPEERVGELDSEGYVFAIGIGDNPKRKKIFSKFSSLKYPNLIHPHASLGHDQHRLLSLAKGNIITSGVCLTNNIAMGNFGIFNLNSTVGHDCHLGNFINLAPGANISGNVCLEEGAYVGTNAAILQGKSMNEKLVVGQYATIGGGAAVLGPVAPFDTVVGVPARLVRREAK